MRSTGRVSKREEKALSLSMLFILIQLYRPCEKSLLYPLVKKLPTGPLSIEDAVALFQDRATAIQPGRLYASQEVAAICERLDRLPLAIELAAIHVKTLSLPMLG